MKTSLHHFVRSTILLWLLCFSFSPQAQISVVDSLEARLKQVTSEKERVDTYNFISEAYQEVSYSKAVEVAKTALNLANALDYREGIWHAYNNLGVSYDFLGVNDSAFYYYRQGVELAIKLDDSFMLATSKNNFGIYYVFRGNYPMALEYLQEALELDALHGEYMDPVVTLANIGVIHEEMGNEEKALEYYRLTAEESLKKKGINELYEAFADLNLGYVAYKKGNYDEANSLYQKALSAYRQSDFTSRVAETLYYLGVVAQAQKQYERAMQYQLEALAIYHELKSQDDLPSMYSIIAEIHLESGQEQEAIDYYLKAAEVAREANSPVDLTNIYDALAQIYADKSDYEQAYAYQQQYRAVNDTIYSQESKNRIEELEMAYEFKLKQVEVDRLKAEQREREAVIFQRTLLGIGAGLIALLVAGIAIVYYRANKQKGILNQNLEQKVAERTAELQTAIDRLSQSNEELERFTYLASHDLKEPLRNISSFVNLIQRRLRNFKDDDIHEFLDFVNVNTKRMFSLVEDVLAISRLSTVENDELELIDTHEVIAEVITSLQVLIEEKKAVVEIEELPRVKAHKAHFFLIFKNLIENGIKYNESEGPQIRISFSMGKNGKDYVFKVKDNGIGVSPRYHEQIFEMFRRLNSRKKYTGSGMGLAICQKIIHRYGGEIWIRSEENVGSTFYISFPVDSPVVSESLLEA